MAQTTEFKLLLNIFQNRIQSWFGPRIISQKSIYALDHRYWWWYSVVLSELLSW